MTRSSAVKRFCCLVLALTLAGCSGSVNPVRDVAVGVGIGATPKEGPDFIRQSRPASVDYLPVGSAATARLPGKTPAEVKAAEAAADQTRTRNEQAAAAARAAATP